MPNKAEVARALHVRMHELLGEMNSVACGITKIGKLEIGEEYDVVVTMRDASQARFIGKVVDLGVERALFSIRECNMTLERMRELSCIVTSNGRASLRWGADWYSNTIRMGA